MLPGRKYTLNSLVAMLRRRVWLVIVPVFLGALGGLLYSRWAPSLFSSDAVVQVIPQRIPESYVQPTVTDRVEDRLTALSQQVLSRTQLEKVILEFNLYPRERQTKPMEDVFELMLKRVQIAPLEQRRNARVVGVDAFRISFDYADAQVSQKVVEKLASFFIDRNAVERGSQADLTSQFLDAQLGDARTRLEAQEKKLEEFRERNAGRLPTQMQTNLQAIQNTQMTLQAMVESLARDRDRKLMLERLYSEADTEAMVTAASASGPAADFDPTGGVAGLTAAQRLGQARNAFEQMKQRLKPEHPDVQRMAKLIGDLEKAAADEALQTPLSREAALANAATPEEVRRRDRLREMRVEIESLARQIAFKEGEQKRLQGLVAQYQRRLEAVPGVESEWVALTRDYDTLQATYRELLAKSENSKMAANLEQRQIGEQFRVLDPPRLPLKPSSPNRGRINLIAVFAGLGVGFLLIGFAEIRDTSMRTEADVLGALDIPVLVLVPFEMTDADRRRVRRRRVLTAAAVVIVGVATGAVVWHLRLWDFVV